MLLGDVVANRFEIQRPIATGGMGSVFLATDRGRGLSVAVKVLDDTSGDAVSRFRREAEILARMTHPGVVRYIDHGVTESSEAFLVMELLTGVDLSRLLSARALSVQQSLRLIRSIAEALLAAHEAGVVHRDVKPSNVFLVNEDLDQAKVIDFGVAHRAFQTERLTQSGALLGTIGYMSPEQARGAVDVDARADVFSLGCVLFECLTGRPPFTGQHAIAVLAKVLSEDPPKLDSLSPALPPEVQVLISAMLSKRVDERPRGMAEVIAGLDAIAHGRSWPASVRAPLPRLSNEERRFVTVVLAGPGASTPRDGGQGAGVSLPALAAKVVENAACEHTRLAGGALLLVFSERALASDQAVEGARRALALKRAAPHLRLVLATGRTETGTEAPMGEVIDRAAALLHLIAGDSPPAGVAIDTLTEGLLGPRFLVERAGALALLVEEQGAFDGVRKLLGRPTPFVGRDRELSLLEQTLTECIEDRVPRSVLVAGTPGVGKTRMALEFLQRARKHRRLRVFVGRAEPDAAGSPLALGQQIVAQATGIEGVRSNDEQRAGLRRYVDAHFEPPRRAVMLEFLGASMGLPPGAESSTAMRAAQNDPAAMQEQKRRAFAALVDAELGRAPVMVLLEDLHWGDALTVQYLDEALSHPDPRPLFVLALGRPEVRGLLRPRGLGRELQEISLSALTPRASERLVLAVLGEGAAPEVVARLVERSGGNAFYLEELIRAVADGELTLPDTVLAMAQSRIERLPPEARRVLRAASVYGGSFTQEAIAALLQGETNTVARLDVLESRELLVSTTDAPGGAERSYAFRHALLRDAAYAMLTETDRRRAHTLAADWLERLDNPDPGVIAQHLENGGEAARAIPWLVRAATLALGSGALPDATARATRGIALGADGDELGLLRVVEGLARAYGGLPASSAMEEALERLEPGTSLWWTALAISFYDAGTRGRFDRARELAMLAFSREPGDELTGPYAMAVNAVIAGMMFLGQMDAGASFLERLETSASRDASGDPLFFAWLDAATSLRLTHSAQGGVWQLQRALSLARDSAQSMAQSGSRSGEAHALFNESSVALYLGLYERVEHAALEAIELAERSHAAMSGTWARLQLAIAHLHTGRVQSGIELLLSLEGLDLFQSQSRHVFLATAYLKAGRLAEAKQEADEAYAGPPNFLSGQAASVSAQAALALDEPEKALECVDRHPSALPWWTADLLGTKALALRALGRESEALDAATAARSTVLCAAEGIEDAALRASVFGRVPEVVRTLAIAADFGLD